MKHLPLISLALLVALSTSCIEKQGEVTTRQAPWDAFEFRALKSPRSRSCNLGMTAPALSGDAELRLLFELQAGHEDYYCVSVTAERIALNKVECGVEVPLATWGETGTFTKEQRVTVMRRPGKIGVCVGLRKVIEVSDDTFTQGGAAVGAVGLKSVPRVTVRSTGEIYAADDFMRTKDDDTAWVEVSGDWAVEFLKNPGLSANAFVYAGQGSANAPGVTLLGEEWWDDYIYEASVKAVSTRGFGLIFRYADGENYYIFRHADTTSGKKLQLVRVSAGKEAILGEMSDALAAGQWYRMGVRAHGTRLTATVDDHQVFTVRDGHIAFGRVGLYVGQGSGVEFDDAFVRGERGAYEDFSDGKIAWYPKGGSWTVEQGGARPLLKAVGPDADGSLESGKLIGGEETWEEYRVAATVEPGARGECGIVVRYRGDEYFDEFCYDAAQNEYRLVEVRDGVRRVVGRSPAKAIAKSRTLAAGLVRNVVTCRADGQTVLTHFDAKGRPGKAGLFVGKGSEVRFGKLEVTFPRESEPVLTQLDTFARESTMSNWAAAASDWQERPTTLPGESRSVRWHRAAFPGGGELIAAGFFDPMKKGKLHLYTGWDLSTTGSATSGYELIAHTTAMGESKGRVELKRNGASVASADAPALRGMTRVALRRVADYVMGEVNGKVVLAYKDKQPLGGWRSGYAGDAVLVKPEAVSVFCPNTTSYSFVRAASDWRFAGGEWMVTNRWRCDPRWSFFGGENMSGVAAIWNKTKFSGDITLEFAAGIRHQQARGGYARHVSDMNAVICGDGNDLNSGYGFMYGGWSNSKTAITRNGVIVKEVPTRIPTGGIHRRWFYYKIVKKGANLKYYIDNVLVLEYTDPDPLPDGRIALWTWNNGLMVARVRIASREVGEKSKYTAAFAPVSPCIYKK
jgi:hypothetical protein